MAFLKYAKAKVVTPRLDWYEWDRVRVASGATKLDVSIRKKAEEVLGEPFTPDRFLLTHSTIVCSVDAVPVPGVKTGSKIVEGSSTINRKYADYRVTSETDKYINNNLDCWSRGVIKKSFKTFVGAHNFVEHVQVEELSKGRIIDAVLRDVGESIYVDILVATDKKHTELVDSIVRGEMNAMSMGCFVPNTPITLGDGTRVAISEAHVGDHVITHTGESKVIKNIMIHRSADAWEMRTISAIGVEPITSTANHPFLVVRPVETCACGCGETLEANHKDPKRNLDLRFKRGHDKKIFNPNNTYSEEESKERLQKMNEIKELNVVEIPASEVRIGDYLLTPRVKDTSSTPVERAKARLLGYFLAEGSFLKNKGELVGVEFSFSFDEMETYATEVKNLLLEAFPQENEARVYPREQKGSSRVQVSSRSVAQWFLTHGGEYSNSKKLSLEVMNWSLESHLEMIGAWVNGDGHLHNVHEHTSACTTSYDLACQMEILLAKCGLASRMEVQKSDGYRQTSYNLVVGKIEAQALSPYCDKVASSTSHERSTRLTENYVLRKVTSTSESFYEGEVYDLEVEDDHTYLVQGVAVHNCSVDFTICTRCGHVAADEPQMCPHVKYEKGNVFYDEQGNKHRVAELCGHETEGETGGVTFIEASWVAVPAFKGAVARNILEIPSTDANPAIPSHHNETLNRLPAQWMSKAASYKNAFDFDLDGEEGEEGEDKKEDAKPADPASILDEIESVVKDAVIDRLKKKLEKEIRNDLADKELEPATSDATTTDDTIIKEGNLKRQKLYLEALGTAVKVANTRSEAISNVRLVNDRFDVYLPPYLYKIAEKLEPAQKYQKVGSLISSAENIYGGKLTQKDTIRLVRLAKLMSLKYGL